MLADGKHEMRFPQADAAVKKERVVNFAGIIRDRAASGGDEFVVCPDHKVLEGVSRVKAIGQRAFFGDFLGDDFDLRSFRRGRLGRVRSGAADEADLAGCFEHHQHGCAERPHVVVFDPVSVDVVWNSQGELFGTEFYEAGFTKPAVENIGRDRGAELLGYAGPNRAEMDGFFCVIHRGDVLCCNGLSWSRADVEMHFHEALF